LTQDAELTEFHDLRLFRGFAAAMSAIHFRSIIAFMLLFFPSRLLAEEAQVLRGCLGAPVVACIEAMTPYLREIDYRLALKNIDAYQAGDINGIRRKTGIVSLPYHSKFAELGEPNQMLIITYSANLIIQEIQIFLRHNPMVAETDAEYERTRLYEAAIFALGPQPSCATMETPHNFYVYFHNNIKNSIKITSESRHTRAYPSGKSLTAATNKASLCGRSIQFLLGGDEDPRPRPHLGESLSSEFTESHLKYGIKTKSREVDKIYTGGDYVPLGSSVIFK
jgi:hypothetical protein